MDTCLLKTLWRKTRDPRKGTLEGSVGAERDLQVRREHHQDQYQQMLALHTQGFKLVEIAQRVGVSTRTIQRWLKAGAFPETKRRKRPSPFDPHAVYVLKRWEEGCRNGLLFYQEIKALG